MVSSADKHAVAEFLQQRYRFSLRYCSRLLRMSRYQKPSKRALPDRAVIERMQQLAVQYPAYGCPLLHQLLKSEGLVVNHKRTERLYRLLNLQIRTKRRKKIDRPRQVLLVPSAPNQRWSMDFVADQLAGGQRIRILNVIDDYSRECIGQLVQASITGAQVAAFLNSLIERREGPKSITCDNGSEFTGKAMFEWQQQTGVRLSFIQPGKPTQNGFVESFNGKFRANCLNLYWFKCLEEARETIDIWRKHYNEERPHSSLNYLPPAVFAAKVA